MDVQGYKSKEQIKRDNIELFRKANLTSSIIIPVNVDILATHQRLSIVSTRRKYDDDRDNLGQRSRKATLAQGATGNGGTPESLSSPLFTFIFPSSFFSSFFCTGVNRLPPYLSQYTEQARFLIKGHNLQLFN